MLQISCSRAVTNAGEKRAGPGERSDKDEAAGWLHSRQLYEQYEDDMERRGRANGRRCPEEGAKEKTRMGEKGDESLLPAIWCSREAKEADLPLAGGGWCRRPRHPR